MDDKPAICYVLYSFFDSRKSSDVDIIGVYESQEEAVLEMDCLAKECHKKHQGQLESVGALGEDLIFKQITDGSILRAFSIERADYHVK